MLTSRKLEILRMNSMIYEHLLFPDEEDDAKEAFVCANNTSPGNPLDHHRHSSVADTKDQRVTHFGRNMVINE